ncbi:MAG TPA: L,D-transpeptidase [Candidatus Binatia bacterium]|nr:L,D-transpeptidase [Candidatus Binatia bacterium]
MRNSGSARQHREQARLLFAVLFLLSFPAWAQVENRRLLLVSIPDHRLAVIENGQVTKIYPVAVGKASTPSPTGDFRVVVRVVNPTYYHEGKVIAPGPHNPLGARWIGLDRRGYGIHGTNAPQSIGRSASHGCIRMAKHDLEELFSMVRVGDQVNIRGERDDQTAAVFGMSSAAETVAEVAESAPGVATESAGQ